MNTYRPDIFCKAKTRHQCFVLLLCFHLALGDVPGPCRHSVTKDHLQKLKRLIENQLQNGCVINYTFTEHLSLGRICYVKAAFHQIQDLLHSQFKYTQSSDNYRYVNELQAVIKNIYAQKCVPDIDQAHEDDPIKFQKVYSSSPKEALQKVQNVIETYMELMTEGNTPVNWNCEDEYAQDYPESTTVNIQMTGPTTQCHCSCPTLFPGSADQVALPSRKPWRGVSKPNFLQAQFSQQTPGITQTPHVTQNPEGCQSTNLGFDSSSKVEATDTSVPSGINKVYEDASTNGLAIFGGTETNSKHLHSASATHGNDEFSFTASYGSFQPVSVSINPVSPELLDGNTAWPTASRQVTEVLADDVELGTDTQSMVPLDSTKSLTQNGIHTFTTSEPEHESVPKTSSNVFSKTSLDELTTTVAFREAAVGVTPDTWDENTAVILVKRSVDPRLNKLWSTSESDSKSWMASNVPLVPEVSSSPDKEGGDVEDLSGNSKNLITTPQVVKEMIRTTLAAIPLLRGNGEMLSKPPGLSITPSPHSHPHNEAPSAVPNSESISVMLRGGKVVSPGSASHSSSHPAAEESSPDKNVGDQGKNTKMNTPEPPDISYKIVCILASVCGGLLLLTTVYCYKEHRKLKALLQRHKMIEDQRLNICSSDLEIQNNMVWQRCAAEEEDVMSSGKNP